MEDLDWAMSFEKVLPQDVKRMIQPFCEHGLGGRTLKTEEVRK